MKIYSYTGEQISASKEMMLKGMFPYLTGSNVKRLFVSQKIAPGQKIHTSESGTEEVQVNEIDMESYPAELYESLGRLLTGSIKFPCLFVCDAVGKIIWQKSERAFSLEGIDQDLVTLFQSNSDGEVAEIKRLVAYPKGVNQDPCDGVIRYGLVAPLHFRGKVIGALCGLNDAEMAKTAAMSSTMKSAAALLRSNLEAHTANLEAQQERADIAEIQEFLRKGWGEAFLGMLCKKMAQQTEMEWAMVVGFNSREPKESQTIAVNFQGVSIENFKYSWQDSPLAGMKGAEVVVVPREVASQAPKDQKIKQEKMESFAGMGLVDAKGKLAGAVVLMGREPIKNPKLLTRLLEVVGARTAAELAAAQQQAAAKQQSDEQNLRFEALFKSGSGGVMISTQAGQVTAANTAMLERLQYSEKELKSVRYTDLFLQDESGEEQELRQACLDGKRSGYTIRKTFRRNDQSTFVGQASVSVIPDLNSSQQAFLEVVEDLSQQETEQETLRKVQTELQEVQSLQGSLFHSRVWALAEVDLEGRVIKANEAWLTLLEHAPSEMTGVTLAGLFPQDQQALEHLLNEGRTGNSVKSAQLFKVLGKTNEVRQVEVSLSPVRDAAGKTNRFIIGLQDHTLEERQSETIQVAQEGLQALKSMPGMALAWLGQNAGFIRSSLEMESYLDRQMPALGQLTLYDLLPAELEEQVREGLAQVAAGNKQVHGWTCEVQAGDEESKALELSVIKIPDQGDGEAFLLGCQNRTDAQRFEREAAARTGQLEGVLEASSQGIIFVDSVGTILHFNPASLSIFGVDSDLLTESDLLMWLEGEARRRLMQRLGSIESENQFSLKCDLVRANERVPLVVTGRAVTAFNEAEGSNIWILFLEDQRSQLKSSAKIANLSDQLAQAELQAKALKEVHSIGIFRIEPDAGISEVNTFIENQLGDDVFASACSLSELFTWEGSTESIEQSVQECLEGKRQLFEFEANLKRQNEKEIRGQVCLHPVKRDGKVLYLVGTWQDTSELLGWEEKWKNLEAPLREVIDGSPSGLLFLDGDLQITQASAPMCQILDKKADQVQGTPFADILHHDDMVEAVTAVMQEEASRLVRVTGRAGDECSIYMTSRKFCVGENDDQYWYLVLMTPQGESLKLEAEAVYWRKRFESLYERDDVAMGSCDEQGQLVEMNSGLLRLAGMSRETLQYKTWNDFMVDQDWELPEEETGAPAHFESTFQFSDGRSVYGRLLVRPSVGRKAESGAKYSWLLQDISGEAQAKEWGKIRDLRLKAFLSNPVVGLGILNQDGQVVELNARFEEFFGLQHEVAIGKDLSSWLPDDEVERFRSDWEELIQSKRSRFQFEAEVKIECEADVADTSASMPETRKKQSRLTVILLDAENPNESAVVLLEDLTELSNTRQQLAQTQEQLAQMESELAEEHTRFTAELEAKGGEIEQQQRALEVKNTEYTTQAAELASLLTRHAQLEGLSRQQKSESEELEVSLQDMVARAEAAEKKGEELQATIDETVTRAETIEAKLEETSNQYTQQKSDTEHLQQEKQSLQQEFEALQDELRKHQEEFAELETKQAELEEKVASQSKRLEEAATAERASKEQLDAAVAKRDSLDQEVVTLKQTLETSEAEKPPQLSEVIEGSEVALAFIDRERTILEHNMAFMSLFGVVGAAGQHLDDVLGYALNTEQAEIIESVFDHKLETFHMEVPFDTGDQEYHWFRITGSPLNQENRPLEKSLLVVEDITPQYAALSQQTAAEQRFKAVAKSDSIGVMMTDVDGKVFFCNPVLTTLLGEEKGGVNGKTINDYAHEDDPQEDVRLDERGQEGELEQYQIEKMLVTVSGDLLWVRMNVRIVRLETGEFWYTLRIIENLSQLYEAREQLGLTQNRLDKVFELSDSILVLLNSRGQVSELSNGAREFFGLESNHEVIRKKLSDMGEMGSDKRFSHQLGLLQDGKVQQARVVDELVNAQKEKVRVEAVLHALSDGEGQLESIIATLSEVPSKSEDSEGADDTPQKKLSDESGQESDKPQAFLSQKEEEKPNRARTQTLKDSVRISDYVEIDTSHIKLPKPPSLQKESLKNKQPSHEKFPKGWILVDSSGRVVLLNSVAVDILGLPLDQALLKPLTEVFHTKDQKVWPLPEGDLEEEIVNANLLESQVWDQNQDVKTVIHRSLPVMDRLGQIAGTAVFFLPLSEIKNIPGYSDPITAEFYKKCALSFISVADKIQGWVTREVVDYYEKCDRLTPEELVEEAVAEEKKITSE